MATVLPDNVVMIGNAKIAMVLDLMEHISCHVIQISTVISANVVIKIRNVEQENATWGVVLLGAVDDLGVLQSAHLLL